MTYTDEELARGKAALDRAPRPMTLPPTGAIAARIVLDAVLPGYTQRIQAEQAQEFLHLIGVLRQANPHFSDGNLILNSVEAELARAAALAPPVEPPRRQPTEPYHGDGVPNTVLHDLRAIMAALGIDDYARPYSPHEVVQREVLPAIERLRSAPPVEPIPPLETSASWGDPAPPVEQP